MPSLSLEVQGLNEALKAAERAGASVQPLNRAAITNSVNRVQSETRRRAAHRSGTMQRSILTQVNYPNGQVNVDSPQGVYNEFGTGIYGPRAQPIVPKKAKALAWKSGGSMIFAKAIKGMKKQEFFRPGVEASMGYIQKQFVAVIDKIMIQMGDQ